MFHVAIIGCGGIAQVHAAVLHNLPDTELIACADIRPERAEAMAQKYGCRAYDSMDSLLDAESPDSVHLCTPHYLHAPMAQKAALRGIAVFSEKPPLIRREQWAMLEDAASRVPLGFCFQNRYNPNAREAKRLIDEGVYGELLGARAFVTWKRELPYYRDSGWRGAWETEGGGVLINQSVHTLDLLVRLMGHPDTVEAHMANHHLRGGIEVEDTVEAYLVLGGKPALFYATTAYTQDAPVMIELHLERATLRLESDALEIRTKDGVEHRTFRTDAALGKGYWGTGHTACIADFYDSIQNHRPFGNDLDSVRDTADAMVRMYEEGKKTL
ncbi:MAG: Gfo/Idh/MocA family oxidoreductase [Clostridia bacterium]|nr:Gfo/Idh/MocA family oxidoreductase [Clostridia bacterium]